jgi:multidrug efflux system outer membrane protein
MRWRLPLLLLPSLLTACMLGPDYQRPELDVPPNYRQAVEQGENFANVPWWELFGDPVLVELIRVALEENQDLAIAAARISEYRAILGLTETDAYPRLDGTGSASRAEGSENVFPGNQVSGSVDNFRLSADVFWEIDLFGRLRRANEAARAQLLATEEARQAISIALVADVADSYMLLRDLDARRAIAISTREARAKSLEIIQARFDKGTVPLLDVNQAEIELAVADATVSAADRAVAQTENTLSILLGRNPGAITRGLTLQEQVMPPAVPTGLPSELLQRRPDVRSAEAELAAQTARIGVAEAARWPSLSLTGSLGLESNELSDLTESDSVFWGVGGSLLAPIFNAGANRARVDAEVARAEQALLAYEQTVRRAFREVEDSLVAVGTYRSEHAARERQVAAARSAATLSRARYDGGVTSYLEVLDAERSQFNAELTESETLGAYIRSVIQLYKALGGGWNPGLSGEIVP